MPITRVDDVNFGDGATPGPVTKKIKKEYWRWGAVRKDLRTVVEYVEH